MTIKDIQWGPKVWSETQYKVLTLSTGALLPPVDTNTTHRAALTVGNVIVTR